MSNLRRKFSQLIKLSIIGDQGLDIYAIGYQLKLWKYPEKRRNIRRVAVIINYSNNGTCKYRLRLLATFPWTTLTSPCLKMTRLRTRLDENLVCLYLWRNENKTLSNLVDGMSTER